MLLFYGGSQARGRIGATTASLHHSHSNMGSEPCLQPTPQLTATADPLLTDQGQGSNPQCHVPSQILLFCCATMGTPKMIFKKQCKSSIWFFNLLHRYLGGGMTVKWCKLKETVFPSFSYLTIAWLELYNSLGRWYDHCMFIRIEDFCKMSCHWVFINCHLKK